MSNSAASIAKLRAIATHLVECDDPETAAWFAACLAEFESGARHGLDLGDAFGLRPGPGGNPWWEVEDRNRRDDLLRSIARRRYPQSTPRAAALDIAQAAARYEAAGWRRHRAFASPPPEIVDTLRGDLFTVLKTGQPVSFKVIYSALRVCPETPDFRAHGQESNVAKEDESTPHESHSDETQTAA